jgi:hypothetical protein
MGKENLPYSIDRITRPELGFFWQNQMQKFMKVKSIGRKLSGDDMCVKQLKKNNPNTIFRKR